MQQLKTILLAKFSKAFNQLFLQAIKLIAAFRQIARVDLIFQPNPLKKRCFIQRCWRVGIIFEQLRLADAVPGQIEAGIERRLLRLPGLANKTPGMFWNTKLRHQLIAGDDAFYYLEAHLVQLGGNVFQFFHLGER